MRVGKDAYVEFWKKVGNTAMPALGSDGVLFVDGRWTLTTMHEQAQKVGRQRKFHGYMVRSGPMNRPGDRDCLTSVREIEYFNDEGEPLA